MQRRRFFSLSLAALFAPGILRAEHYLDQGGAAKALFPEAEAYAPASVDLDAAAISAIKQRSGMRVRQKRVISMEARKAGKVLGWVYVDEVIGKHEFITYALGLDDRGAVRGVEIMDYRETWGGAVRDASWRVQFKGRTLSDPIKLQRDIMNVSGATLSCRNVTDGVRRLLVTNAILKRA